MKLENLLILLMNLVEVKLPRSYGDSMSCFSFTVCNTDFGILQAILPLRGKILNIERKDEAAMYKNEEIQNLILGLGLGVKVIYSFFHPFISFGYFLKTQCNT